MRRVVPRAGIGLLCAAVLAIPALMAGPRRGADPGTGTVTVFADADATVAEATPDVNAGAAMTLQATAPPVPESYVRFSPPGPVRTLPAARLPPGAAPRPVRAPRRSPPDP